jgi:hypothetical protein
MRRRLGARLGQRRTDSLTNSSSPPPTFAIVYDMATTVEGAPFLFNPIRGGSVASHERVIDASAGKFVSRLGLCPTNETSGG